MRRRTELRIRADGQRRCKQVLHTPRGAPEIPPRGHARLDHPPLWRRPCEQPGSHGLQFPPHLRRGSFPTSTPTHRDMPGLVRLARTYPWWDTTGAFFSPQTPSGLGDDRAPTRLHSWDAHKGPPMAAGASLQLITM